MAPDTEFYLNTSGHPLDLDDGSIVAAGEVAELVPGELVYEYEVSGLMRRRQEPTKGAKQERHRQEKRLAAEAEKEEDGS